MPPPEEPDLVERLYEATIRPERFDALIALWDERLAATGENLDGRLADIRSEPFLRHVERAISILDGLNVFEFQQLDAHLAGVPNPAVVLSPGGAVVASNEAARAALSLYPGGSVRSVGVVAEDQEMLVEALARVVGRPGGDGEVLRCRSAGGGRDLRLHLRPIGGGRIATHVLMVSGQTPWNAAAGALLGRAFGLTEAEVAVVRRLCDGESVGEIALSSGRVESTIRSQVHAILSKTGTESQAEILRLAALLHTSLALEPERGLAAVAPDRGEAPSREIRMRDGRRLRVLRFGEPGGRTVVWLHSQLGLFTPTRSGEADLRRLGVRVLVPIRAGYGPSDPVPLGRDVLELAVDDHLAVMDALGVERAPVVALVDDIWIALALARRAPERVAAVVGIAAGFPITRPEHYRKLHPVGRFFRACARHAPQLLPFMLRLIRARMIRSGMDSHARSNMRSPADLDAMDDPEIFDAWMAGFTYLYSGGTGSEAALCAELRHFHRDWPRELGDVACPVTLLHGEQDGNNPFETAREMAESYPGWRFIGRREAGQLVLYGCWDEVLVLLLRALGEDLPPPAPQPALTEEPDAASIT